MGTENSACLSSLCKAQKSPCMGQIWANISQWVYFRNVHGALNTASVEMIKERFYWPAAEVNKQHLADQKSPLNSGGRPAALTQLCHWPSSKGIGRDDSSWTFLCSGGIVPCTFSMSKRTFMAWQDPSSGTPLSPCHQGLCVASAKQCKPFSINTVLAVWINRGQNSGEIKHWALICNSINTSRNASELHGWAILPAQTPAKLEQVLSQH